VAAAGEPAWPDEATRLSYPDWVVDRLIADLGARDAMRALEAMNLVPPVTARPDGYVQDRASQWVAEAVGVRAGERIADLCAGPGGKATWLAASGPAVVVAADIRPARASLVAANAEALGRRNVAVLVADGRRPPIVPGRVDRVLVDAPCSGLGVLARRPDARWRIEPSDVAALAALQRELLDAAVTLVGPGGTVVYSVCTLTAAETVEIDRWLGITHPALEPRPAPAAPWEPSGRGARLLPQAAGTDGMFVLALSR
jgi:16S rRNA (cytosine967-C5)-methyltransferase